MAKPQVENGHLKIANELAEALALVNLSAYESRILWVIFRKTYGWNKKFDRISYPQFVDATGIAHRHIGRTLKSLKDRRMIVCTGEGYDLEYAIQTDYEKWESVPKEVLKSLKAIKNSVPIQDASVPKEVLMAVPIEVPNSVPKEVHTKDNKDILKHITKDIPINFVLPEWLNKTLWDDFLVMRKKMKAPPTDYAKKLLIDKLAKLKEEGNEPSRVIEQSIINNWKGLFPLKGESFARKGAYSGTNAAYRPQPKEAGTPGKIIDGDAEP